MKLCILVVVNAWLLFLSSFLLQRNLQIGILTELINVRPQRLVVGETPSYEVLGTLGHLHVGRKLHLVRIEHGVVVDDGVLRLSVSEGPFSEEHLIKYDTDGPHVHFVADAHASVHHETFRRQVPVGARPLAGQLHAVARVVGLHDLAQSEIGNLDPPVLVEQDVPRLEIVVYDPLPHPVLRRSAEVPHPRQYLQRHRPGLPFRQPSPFLEQGVQVGAPAVLQDGGKGVGVDLQDVEEGDHPGVPDVAVDFVFTGDVPGVVVLLVVGPARVQLVDFDGHLHGFVEVVGPPYFGEAAFAQ
mmetsp:Transcript_20001/g.45410  ORF Transcript_20001/g.45410 Transcript_20001/m.45410 type:complete len:299 (-) Transcript_20001:396-1292(-)